MSSPRRASTSAPDPALLVRQFDAFYSLLQSLSARLARGSSGADTARDELVKFFEHQENQLRPLGAGYLNDIATPARRVMALMVDQLLGTELDWPGRDAWAADPLAPKLTGADSDAAVSSQVAADLEHLLQVKKPSAGQKALARVFLESLGLGLTEPFKDTGKDTGPAEDTEIESLKTRLYAFLYPQASTESTPQLLFPEAYAHTVSHGDRALLPTARPWWRILAISSLLLLLISWPIWRDATELVRAALAKVPATESVSAGNETRSETSDPAHGSGP